MTDCEANSIHVHMKALPLMQFSDELLVFSYKHRLYLLPHHNVLGAAHFGSLDPTSLKRNSRWTFSCSELGCWLPISQHLGFNHMPSNSFFLLSPRSHWSVFQDYAVVEFALGFSSISGSWSGVHFQNSLYLQISLQTDYTSLNASSAFWVSFNQNQLLKSDSSYPLFQPYSIRTNPES